MKFKYVDLLANAVSIVFHPLLIPTLIYSLLGFYIPETLSPFSSTHRLFFLCYIFVTTWLLPSLAIYSLYLAKIISSLHLDTKADRTMVALATFALYAMTTFVLVTKLKVNDTILTVQISLICSILLSGLITIYWKISLHAAAVSGFVTLLAVVAYIYRSQEMLFPLSLCLLVSGIVMSARLYLNKHTPFQILAGTLLGCTISIVASVYILD